MQDVLAIWMEKIRAGEFQWFAEWIKRVDPATVVQELTIAGALESPDLRAALLAGLGTQALESGNGSAGDTGKNGSNGSGV
jgi:hypothetical protein